MRGNGSQNGLLTAPRAGLVTTVKARAFGGDGGTPAPASASQHHHAERAAEAGAADERWATDKHASTPAVGSDDGARVAPSLGTDSQLWLASQVLDYVWMLAIAGVVQALFGGRTTKYTMVGSALACFGQGAAAVAVLHARERVYFALFRGRLPECKQQSAVKSPGYIFQTYAMAMSALWLNYQLDLMYITAPSVTLAFWSEVFVPFFALLLLRDVVFLGPLHRLLHSKRWYHLHKLHHEVKRDAQSLHAFHIDAIDLIIENVGAPFLLCAGQRLLGLPVRVHWLSIVLLTFHDAGLHSVNPYSVMYFNPLLDWVLHANVTHQLHHALNRGHYLFVPYQHVCRGRREADCAAYNAVFKTDFTFS